MGVPVDTADVGGRFARLGVWARDGVRAPHKPLLVLYALGRRAAGDLGPLRFADVERPLRRLLERFGPPRRRHHPEFPFWYLQTDRVWVVHPPAGYPSRPGTACPSARQLREFGAAGWFAPEVAAALAADDGLAGRVAHALLDAHFPESLHPLLLEAVGLDPAPPAGRRRRDPQFRERVLRAYGRACAVCGLHLELDGRSVGVDAAHIRWHSAGGPDEVGNGLALCALHHRLFDLGALSLSADGGTVVVSEAAGGLTVDAALTRHHRRPLASPVRTAYRPDPGHVRWHRDQVFRGEERD